MSSTYIIYQVGPWGCDESTSFETRADSDVEAEQAARQWLRDGDWPSDDGEPTTATASIDRWGMVDGEPAVVETWTLDVRVETYNANDAPWFDIGGESA